MKFQVIKTKAAGPTANRKPQAGAGAGARCGGQFFNGFFGTWGQATNLTSHSKSTKQSLNY
jgi:hypothetical protein